jgi:hypothetical protein
MAPLKMASTAAGPALNAWGASVTSAPSFSAKIPFSTPTSPGAWVMLGKYPRRSVTFSAGFVTPPAVESFFESEPQPASASAARRPTARPLLMRCCIFMSRSLHDSQVSQ